MWEEGSQMDQDQTYTKQIEEKYGKEYSYLFCDGCVHKCCLFSPVCQRGRQLAEQRLGNRK